MGGALETLFVECLEVAGRDLRMGFTPGFATSET